MAVTATAAETLKAVLNEANPNKIADALAQVDLGSVLEVREHDTGVITAAAAVAVPGDALAVLSAHVVTSGTAASVGHYMVGNSATTPLLPPGGANAAIGLASCQGITAPGAGLTASGRITTVTFPNTVTRVVFRYIAAPATALTALFNRA